MKIFETPQEAILEDLAARMGKMFENFNTQRQGQLSEIKAIRERVYGVNQGLGRNWAHELELPDLWEQSQTLKAHIIDVLYSHPEGLFDVSCDSIEGEGFALKQKAMLLKAFEDMDLRASMEKIVDSIIETGECTLFVGWEQQKKHLKRLCQADADGNKTGKADADGTTACECGFKVGERVIYEGADVRVIPACDFVFDANRADNWESCPKIYRTWMDVEEILENPLNTCIKADIEASLRALSSASFKRSSILQQDSLEGAKGFKDGLVEVLEYWGDLKLQDGTLAKNCLVVVAGRSHVVRMEENPYINTPFIYASLIENPQTRRGVSPLKPLLALNCVSSSILNKQLDAYSLIINPPYLAPKGAFKGEQEVSPGKIIEFDSSLLPQSPVPLNFSGALSGWDFISYFKTAMESATGVYRTMGGSQGAIGRTATETMQSANGQSARINLIIESINRKIILPMVEKVADTIANFACGKHTVAVVLGDKKVHAVVDDEVRCADYIYRYSDRKASLERQMRQRELANTIMSFSKIPEFSSKINWNECFKFALEQLGVENSAKFLVSETSMPLEGFEKNLFADKMPKEQE